MLCPISAPREFCCSNPRFDRSDLGSVEETRPRATIFQTLPTSLSTAMQALFSAGYASTSLDPERDKNKEKKSA